jgi:phosphoglucomutase/phosphomannomutase
MPVASPLSNVTGLLEQKYGKLGKEAAERLSSWLSGALPFTYPEMLEKHLEQERIELLFDSFWQVLPFGTGGRRGRVGYGSNRLNPTTIAMTVQGHCDYIKKNFSDRKSFIVVVANDVRVFNDFAGTYKFLGGRHPLMGISSRSLAKLACEVYAANGITAYFTEPQAEQAVLSTPELSYLIGKLEALGGVNISASHNPPDDNGIKIYDQYGSQPIAPNDQLLVEAMDRITRVNRMDFEQARRQGLVQRVARELHQQYVQQYVTLYGNIYTPRSDNPIVYTPLCGCGLTTVGDVLKQLNFPFAVPPHQGADGSFAVIPFRAPNPEVPQATGPAKEFADEKGLGLVLSSDPDADRIGVEVKLRSGKWQHFDGNQIAAVLCYFLMLDPHGPKRKGLVIETLVTTKILGKIVEKAGDSCLIDDLLVGFKYVADVLKQLDQNGHYKDVRCSSSQLVLATEESHGVIMIPTIRDKDAVPGCIYLAALYQLLKSEGRDLLDYYIQILDEVGPYADTSRSIMMTGADGIFKRDQIMQSLRESPLAEVAGAKVRKSVDHWDQQAFGKFKSETDKLPRNVLQYFFDSFVIAIRPSGTEPKLKFYVQVLPSPELAHTRGRERFAAAAAKAEELAVTIYKTLVQRINVELDEPALLLPDIVDLGRKQQFQERTLPAFEAALRNGKFRDLEKCLKWLQEQDEVKAMTPGADPTPALKAPLRLLTEKWGQHEKNSALLEELHRWASK